MIDSSSSFGGNRPWSRSVTRLVSFAEKNGKHVIGIAGQKTGIGVSMLSMELARTYIEFGKPALLVDASHLDLDRSSIADERDIPFDLYNMSQKSNTGLATIDLAEFAHLLPSGRQAYKRMFAEAAKHGVQVIVDLPPVSSGPGMATPGFMVAGAACETVYLVCLTGDVSKAELSDCIEICKINRIALGGIIPNDWKLMGSGLLS